MDSITIAATPRQTRLRPGAARALPAELLVREPRLAVFGFVLLALLVPLSLAWGLDERSMRGANVWIKPMKFALSLALFSLTTAWFVGHLEPARRRSRAVGRIVWILIGTAAFELAYITVQAALGQASHFNEADAFHATMYALMGAGALALAWTQPMLAWQVWRGADSTLPRAYRHAVVLGLVLTFALGATVGGLLSGNQPPDAGAGTLPIFGWSFAGGDLRPAHFVGIHAQQAIPLVGFAAAALAPRRAGVAVWAFTLGWVALFAGCVALGLARPA